MNKIIQTLIDSSSLGANDKLRAKGALAHVTLIEYSGTVKVGKKTNKHRGILAVFNLVDKEWQVECFLLSLHGPNALVEDITVKAYDKVI